MPILATKLYIPQPRARVVSRFHLIERLDEGRSGDRKLTLLSAPAGFGKTTLVSEWLASCRQHEPGLRAGWLSLDEGDNDPVRFLIYLVSALQTVAPHLGEGILGVLQGPQVPPTQLLLTALLNEISTLPHHFIFVLDDYHVIDSAAVDEALAFLVENLPPQMHLLIASREDPPLPLARFRAGGQLTELRAADLRFTPAEAADFLNHVMGLNLSAEDIAALEARTEGWIAGLQLAAISMQGSKDTAGFIKSFTGSHHFVLDYLVEEVMQQQPESVQAFLLSTSILTRLCGPLCDAVMLARPGSGQETLENLERANLFLVPLDYERRWYRYHHLFGDFLRQRLGLHPLPLSFPSGSTEGPATAALHRRASQWYEDNGLELEAFHHAAAAGDIERAQRLSNGISMAVHSRAVSSVLLDWLASLPKAELDARPALWTRYAGLLLVTGQTTGVEEKLQAAEAALQGTELDDKGRDLVGVIAAARATLALTHYDVQAMMAQSQRALKYLSPHNLTFQFTAYWVLSVAYLLSGERAAAGAALTEAVSISQTSGDMFSTILATDGLGQVQEMDNHLHAAAENYRRVLLMVGDFPQPNTCELHLGLARICYEWNDLEAAEQHGQKSLQLARMYESVIDRFVICQVFLARLKLARGDVSGAAGLLAEAEASVRQQNFIQRLPEIAAVQVLVLLRQGSHQAAAALAEKYDLPLSRARVYLAQGDSSTALALLEPLRQQMEAKAWEDERLKVMILEGIALRSSGEKERALKLLSEVLALAEPGGFVRSFIDEGPPMAQLLSEIASQAEMPGYVSRLLDAFQAEQEKKEGEIPSPSSQALIEPLSPRELEVLQLIAQGYTNREISARLYLALDTVKGHNRRIFEKLQVQNRTQAVRRARQLGVIQE